MHNAALTHSIRQMALVGVAFMAATLLLESGGLVSWATHLEIGPLRSVAVPATAALDRALKPLHVDAIREDVLSSLARIGWADDAALVAASERERRAADTAKVTSCMSASTLAAGPAGTPAAGARSGMAKASGAQSPLVAWVPRATALAPLTPVDGAKPRVVALAGDSMMAVGLSATLMRQASADKHLRIVKAFRSGTGLARPEVFNWMDEYPAMIGVETPDVVIVAIGANDGQGFVVDGKVLTYGSADWLRVYQERLAAYLAMLEASGARVVWVGLPPMRVAAYNEKIATINRIAYTVVSQSPAATWWNPVGYVGDEEGNFREFMTLGNGETLRLRATDGIHLSDEGANLLSSVLIKWLDPPAAVNVAVAEPPGRAGTVVRLRRRAHRSAKS